MASILNDTSLPDLIGFDTCNDSVPVGSICFAVMEIICVAAICVSCAAYLKICCYHYSYMHVASRVLHTCSVGLSSLQLLFH